MVVPDPARMPLQVAVSVLRDYSPIIGSLADLRDSDPVLYDHVGRARHFLCIILKLALFRPLPPIFCLYEIHSNHPFVGSPDSCVLLLTPKYIYISSILSYISLRRA